MSDVVERAVMCANGKQHFGNEYLEHDDPERGRTVADGLPGDSWCGGAPHYIASRHRILTDWQRTE